MLGRTTLLARRLAASSSVSSSNIGTFNRIAPNVLIARRGMAGLDLPPGEIFKTKKSVLSVRDTIETPRC